MSPHRPTDNDVSIAEWLAETQAHQTAPATRPPGSPPPLASSAEPEPVYAYGPVQHEVDDYSEARQRERYGGLNWGAGFFGWLVAAGLLVVLSSVVATGVAALGLTDEVLSADAEGVPGVEAIATAAALFGVLLVAFYIGGYVAGRMSRFDGGKQGVAVWLTGLLLGGIGIGVGLLVNSRHDTLDQLSLPTMPVLIEGAALNGVIVAVAILFASLLAAVVGGKVGCRYHGKVDDAAYL